MSEFMFRFLRLNSFDNCSKTSQAMESGKLVYECTYKYSTKRFSSLLKDEMFQVLIKTFVNLRRVPGAELEAWSMSKEWENQFQNNKGGFSDLISKYLSAEFNQSVETALQDAYERCTTT